MSTIYYCGQILKDTANTYLDISTLFKRKIEKSSSQSETETEAIISLMNAFMTNDDLHMYILKMFCNIGNDCICFISKQENKVETYTIIKVSSSDNEIDIINKLSISPFNNKIYEKIARFESDIMVEENNQKNLLKTINDLRIKLEKQRKEIDELKLIISEQKNEFESEVMKILIRCKLLNDVPSDDVKKIIPNIDKVISDIPTITTSSTTTVPKPTGFFGGIFNFWSKPQTDIQPPIITTQEKVDTVAEKNDVEKKDNTVTEEKSKTDIPEKMPEVDPTGQIGDTLFCAKEKNDSAVQAELPRQSGSAGDEQTGHPEQIVSMQSDNILSTVSPTDDSIAALRIARDKLKSRLLLRQKPANIAPITQ